MTATNGTTNGSTPQPTTHKQPSHIADIASQFKQVKVGVVQCTPKLFSLQGSTDVVCKWIAEGAAQGCQLLLLPESTIPGYPRGLKFDATVGKRSDKSRDDWLMFWSNSFVVGSQQHHQIAAAVKAANMYTVVGVTERDEIGGSLHCCVLHFGKDGTLLGKHRKLKPTALERYIWGESGAEHLVSFNSKSCGRISGLVCWEHLMPLARSAIYKTGVEVWLAPTADARPQWQSIMTHIALEGRCFVLSSNQVCKKSDYPAEYQAEIKDEPEQMSAGGSVIIDPLGNVLAGPLWNEEGLLTATLDFSQIARSKLDFDVIGHYARNDVFKLEVLGQMPPTVDVE